MRSNAALGGAAIGEKRTAIECGVSERRNGDQPETLRLNGTTSICTLLDASAMVPEAQAAVVGE